MSSCMRPRTCGNRECKVCLVCLVCLVSLASLVSLVSFPTASLRIESLSSRMTDRVRTEEAQAQAQEEEAEAVRNGSSLPDPFGTGSKSGKT
jgi:hypothetical protein